MDYVKLNHVTYLVGGRETLHDIDVGFARKKVTAIVGKSGSGKSTLIKLINGLLRPSLGTITVENEVIGRDNLRSHRRKTGYVVQGVGLFPHLTVRENILLPGKIHNQPIETSRLLELVALVNLPPQVLEKYPHQLSGGEQQRVGISRALVLDPPLLLMDEPFGSLDPLTRYGVHDEFLRLKQSVPRTVLLVTHDLREAKKLADDIVILDQGTIQQYGPVQKVIDHPATDATEELIRAADL